jgi:hypothetical protein
VAKVTGRAFGRHIESTTRKDRHADRRIRTGFAFDRHVCYGSGDGAWSSGILGRKYVRAILSARSRPWLKSIIRATVREFRYACQIGGTKMIEISGNQCNCYENE